MGERAGDAALEGGQYCGCVIVTLPIRASGRTPDSGFATKGGDGNGACPPPPIHTHTTQGLDQPSSSAHG